MDGIAALISQALAQQRASFMKILDARLAALEETAEEEYEDPAEDESDCMEMQASWQLRREGEGKRRLRAVSPPSSPSQSALQPPPEEPPGTPIDADKLQQRSGKGNGKDSVDSLGEQRAAKAARMGTAAAASSSAAAAQHSAQPAAASSASALQSAPGQDARPAALHAPRREAQQTINHFYAPVGAAVGVHNAGTINAQSSGAAASAAAAAQQEAPPYSASPSYDNSSSSAASSPAAADAQP
jgi:hypothetical protein